MDGMGIVVQEYFYDLKGFVQLPSHKLDSKCSKQISHSNNSDSNNKELENACRYPYNTSSYIGCYIDSVCFKNE